MKGGFTYILAMVIVTCSIVAPVAAYTGFISEGASVYRDPIPMYGNEISQSWILSGPSGTDFDLYVGKDRYPSIVSSDYSSTGPGSDERIDIYYPTAGWYYAMIHSVYGSGTYSISYPYVPGGGSSNSIDSINIGGSSSSGTPPVFFNTNAVWGTGFGSTGTGSSWSNSFGSTGTGSSWSNSFGSTGTGSSWSNSFGSINTGSTWGPTFGSTSASSIWSNGFGGVIPWYY